MKKRRKKEKDKKNGLLFASTFFETRNIEKEIIIM
jgi:hypothetical protein